MSLKSDQYVVYVLANTKNNCTYVGSTNNLTRRLRQHNKEVSGGAKYTSQINGGWYVAFYIQGFKDKIEALRAEWRLKHPEGKKSSKYSGIGGRINGLRHILNNSSGWKIHCEDKFNNLYICNFREEYKNKFMTQPISHLDLKIII